MRKLVLGLIFTALFASTQSFASNDVFECQEFVALFKHVLSRIDVEERFHFESILQENVRELLPQVNGTLENYSLHQFCAHILPYMEENPTVFLVRLAQAVLLDLDKYARFMPTSEARSQYADLNTHNVTQEKKITHRFIGNILYIKINGFFREKNTENNSNVSVVPEYIKDKISDSDHRSWNKIVIDVRDNTGGEITEACKTVDLFLPEDLRIMTYRLRGDADEKKIDTQLPQLVDIPVDILVNRNTASSAEIVAGALQHYGKARLIGENTYGKTQILIGFSLIEELHIQFPAKVRYTRGRYWIAENVSATDLRPDIYLENPNAPIEELLEIINR